MQVKLIGCASSKNEVQWLQDTENLELHCEFLDYSYHASPKKLKVKLQELINNSQGYDLIILTYSRCSNAVVGLVSPRVPLLFPNTHDCIGLLLGSNERHESLLKDCPETYYFSQGWLDFGRTPYDEYLEYVDRYGEQKAKGFIDALYGRYNRALLIKTPGMKDLEGYRKKIKEIAEFFSWQVEETEGDISLLESVVNGDRVQGTVFVEPGQEVTEEIIRRSTGKS